MIPALLAIVAVVVMPLLILIVVPIHLAKDAIFGVKPIKKGEPYVFKEPEADEEWRQKVVSSKLSQLHIQKLMVELNSSHGKTVTVKPRNYRTFRSGRGERDSKATCGASQQQSESGGKSPKRSWRREKRGRVTTN